MFFFFFFFLCNKHTSCHQLQDATAFHRKIKDCSLGYDISETFLKKGDRGGSVVECRTPEREVGGSKPTAAVLCP